MSQHRCLQALLRQSFFRLMWRQSLPVSIQASLPLPREVKLKFLPLARQGALENPRVKVAPEDAISVTFLA